MNYIICAFNEKDEKDEEGALVSLSEDFRQMKNTVFSNFEKIEVRQKNLELGQQYLTQKIDTLNTEFKASQKLICNKDELPRLALNNSI